MKPLIRVFVGDSGLLYTFPNGQTKFSEFSWWEWFKFAWWCAKNKVDVEITE